MHFVCMPATHWQEEAYILTQEGVPKKRLPIIRKGCPKKSTYVKMTSRNNIEFGKKVMEFGHPVWNNRT